MVNFLRLSVFWLSVLSPLPALLIGWRQRQNPVWVYALVCLVCDSAYLIPGLPEAAKGWTGNVFMMSEALLLQLIFMRQIAQPRLRQGLWAAFGVAALFFVCHKIRYPGMDVLRLEAVAPFYIVYALLSMAGFYHLLNLPVPVPLARSPVFFLCTGVLFYAAGSLCIFLFERFLEQENYSLLLQIWTLRNGLNALKNLCFARALYLMPSLPRPCA